MNSSLSPGQRDMAIEQRIDALSVNAAHRRAALAHYRAAVVAADRAVDFTHSLLSLPRTILGGFKRRVGQESRDHTVET
jgi:hypothetical protein